MNILSRLLLLIPIFIIGAETVLFEMVEQKKLYSHTDTTVVEAWLTIVNENSPSPVTLPELAESDQYVIISSEMSKTSHNSVQFINGVRTDNANVKHLFRYTLELIPAGTLTIPELEVEYENEIYRSNLLQVKHRSANRAYSQETTSNTEQAEERDLYRNSSSPQSVSDSNVSAMISTLTIILIAIIGGGIGIIALGCIVGIAVRKSVNNGEMANSETESTVQIAPTDERDGAKSSEPTDQISADV